MLPLPLASPANGNTANMSHANAANMSLANAANVHFSTVVSVLLATAANAAVLTYFGQFLHIEQVSLYRCKNKLVVLTTEWLPWLQTNWETCSGYERFAFGNCISQPKGWLLSSSYNHNALKTLKHL